MAGKFKKHGSLSVAIDGRLIVLKGEGPWNAESLHLSDDKIMQNLRAMYGSPWGVLAIFRGEAVYVPEAFTLLRKQIKKEITLGRVATAVVFVDVKSPLLSRHQFTSIYEMQGHEVAFFEDADEAKAWLNSLISHQQQQA
ncbi:hypothetical protein [uncultured Alteromonas sp.]|jgi:hypothetical protein|uniref:hypothetical protein n=1 Tax=uncultured Alteromonas sp. TaxID=179113 RepID=UPI0025FA15DA|nr:hypothetical protein [uncultured Alteromonas sp.]